MLKLLNGPKRLVLLSTVILLGALLYSGCLPAAAQKAIDSNAVTFHLNGGRVSPPVKVLHFRIDGKEIPFDTPVPLAGMWMKKVEFVVQNISPKTIVKGGFRLWFPEDLAVTTGPVPGLVLASGALPRHALMRRDGSFQVLHSPLPPPIAVSPGMTMTFIPFGDADDVEQRAEGLAGRLSKVNVNFETFYFDDESKWMNDFYVVAVPAPEVWKKVTPEQFFAGLSESQH